MKNCRFSLLVLAFLYSALLDAAILCRDIKLEPVSKSKESFEEIKNDFVNFFMKKGYSFDTEGIAYIAKAPEVDSYIAAIRDVGQMIENYNYGRSGFTLIAEYPFIEKLHSFGKSLTKKQAKSLLEAIDASNQLPWKLTMTGLTREALLVLDASSALEKSFHQSLIALSKKLKKIDQEFPRYQLALPKTFIYEILSLPKEELLVLQESLQKMMEQALKPYAYEPRKSTGYRNLQFLHWLVTYPQVALQFESFEKGQITKEDFFNSYQQIQNPGARSSSYSYQELNKIIKVIQEELSDYIKPSMFIFGSFPNMRANFYRNIKPSDIDLAIASPVAMKLLDEFDKEELHHLPENTDFQKSLKRANIRIAKILRVKYDALSLEGGLNKRENLSHLTSINDYLESVGRVSPVLIELKKESWSFKLYKHFEKAFR